MIEWPTLNHVFYIPLIFALGVLGGAWYGRRSLLLRLAHEERERRALEARRAARRAEREPAQAPPEG